VVLAMEDLAGLAVTKPDKSTTKTAARARAGADNNTQCLNSFALLCCCLQTNCKSFQKTLKIKKTKKTNKNACPNCTLFLLLVHNIAYCCLRSTSAQLISHKSLRTILLNFLSTLQPCVAVSLCLAALSLHSFCASNCSRPRSVLAYELVSRVQSSCM
jgi:hypothetical protein